jgi:hypothetical protein
VKLSSFKDNALKLVFVVLFKDPNSKKLSCILDSVEVAFELGVKKVKSGIFVISRATHKWLADDFYRYWFIDVGDELVRVVPTSTNVLYDKLNIIVTCHGDCNVVREVEYTDIEP